MKTTLNLPGDVANTLRLESAKRGGRKAASLSKLVSDAVRAVYGGAVGAADLDLTPGRAVVRIEGRVTSAEVRAALSD
jgi:hypothetical protein